MQTRAQAQTHSNPQHQTRNAPSPTALRPHSNAQVLDEMRAGSLEEDLGFLDGWLGDRFGNFVGGTVDGRSLLTTGPHHNRQGSESAKRWEDGTLRIADPGARRELAAEALCDGTFSPFDITNAAEFDRVFEHYGDHHDCALASYATLDNLGYDAPRGDRNSVLKRGEIGRSEDGHVSEVDPEAAMRMLDTIDVALADGSPVMIGVDYPGEQHAKNADGVTDHWLVLTNRTYDQESGEVRYEAIDNASGEASHRVFTVGEDYALRADPPPEATPSSGIGQLPYLVTNARVPARK